MICFTSMPSNENSAKIYRTVIKPTVEELGFRSFMGNEIITPDKPIWSSIIDGIRKSTILIADLTEENSNVLFEVGIAKGLNKRLIIISQTKDNISSSLLTEATIIYDSKKANWSKSFRKRLTELLSSAKEPNKYIASYVELVEAGVLSVQYEGSSIDASALAIVQIELQKAISGLASSLLISQELLGEVKDSLVNTEEYPEAHVGCLVKLMVKEIKSGSFGEILTIWLPAIIASPDVRAVLQNLFANFVWNVSYLRFKEGKVCSDPISCSKNVGLTYDVGPNLTRIVTALAKNGTGKVKLTHSTERGENSEVLIEING